MNLYLTTLRAVCFYFSHVAGCILLVAGGARPWPAGAAAFVPPNDGYVLERVRTAAGASEHRRLTEERRRLPATDRAAAVALVRRYLELARAESDARALKYAALVLEPCLTRQPADAELLTLR